MWTKNPIQKRRDNWEKSLDLWRALTWLTGLGLSFLLPIFKFNYSIGNKGFYYL